MPDSRYRAVLIGNWYFPDDPANLPELKGPINDVTRMAAELTGPNGLFPAEQTTVLSERTSQELLEALERFFHEARKDDVLLVYYSGHGLTNDRGDALLMCARNSRTDRKIATMISSDHINAMIADSAASAVVLILDCCHSGSFKAGEVGRPLAGRGRFVLTSCRSKQLAPDADHLTGLSRFTGHLVHGLSGAAGIGSATEHITVTDLYRHVHAEMADLGQSIPQLLVGGDGDVALVTNTRLEPTPPATRLVVATSHIDIGDVNVDDQLATEYVSVRAASGPARDWSVETKAQWLAVAQHGSYFDVDLAPHPGRNSATILVRDDVTGEVHVVRVTVNVLPAATSPSIAKAPAAIEAHPAAAEMTVHGRLEEMLADLRTRWSGTTVLDYPLVLRKDITAPKERAARAALGIPSGATVLALIDRTFWATAKRGWAFTQDTLYVRDDNVHGFSIRYRDLHLSTITADKGGIMIGDVRCPVGQESDTRLVVAMLNTLATIAH